MARLQSGKHAPRLFKQWRFDLLNAFSPKISEQIYALWDELADFDAAQTEASRTRLLEGLCSLAGAQDATWIGAVRMGDPMPGDPVGGWRPKVFHYLRDPATRTRINKPRIEALESRQVDATIIRNVSMAGRFRVNRLVDLVDGTWFDGDYYRSYYLGFGHHDAIWVGIPINEDAESYFGLYRAIGTPAFSESDCAVVGHALRGITWFHRQQMLGEGLHVASEPLTPLERRVLQGLLQGLMDKEIAAELGQSPYTAQEYVKRIFRKYGVSSRTALMALWLGRTNPRS